jgi:hypothetical protein
MLNTEKNNGLNLNLTKEQAIVQLDLRKQEVANLCPPGTAMHGLTSRVCVAMDYSGSMIEMFKSGFVQNVLERLLPIAMQFDDNGEMEVWLFENGCRRVAPISLNNFYGYIKNENFLNKYHMGGTNYAPVMKDIYHKYIIEEPANIPTLVLFITDGNNFDHGDTNNLMKEVSKYPIFWQFVGIGDAQFDYLERLDNLKGRVVDNANFFAVNDLNQISDKELYSRLLGEYPQWLIDSTKANIW